MMSILAGLMAAYLGLVGLLYVAQRNLMYHPGSAVGTPAQSAVPEMRAVQVSTADGLNLTSWYVAARAGKPTVVYYQGNAGTVADRDWKVRPYVDQGYGVFLLGYRGYGGNPGSPSEDGFYADAAAGLAFLEANGVPPAQWVLYGESLGTGIAVEHAHRQAGKGAPGGALVLEAPFTSMGDAAAGHYPYVPARTLVRDKYDSAAKIAAVRTPVFIFHGERDGVVPQKLGKALFEMAKSPKQSNWIAGAGHNNLYDFGAAKAVIEFINQHTAR